MSPAPNTPHFRVHSKIFKTLSNFVDVNEKGEVFFAPVDVYLNNKNIYQPDIFFISTARTDIIKNRGIFGAPDLVIEILSEDRKYDLVTKKKLYEECGVSEYVVVDPVTKWCEGFVLTDGHYISTGESTARIYIRMFELEVAF